MTKSFMGSILEACVECSRDPLDIAQYHGVVVEENVNNLNAKNLDEEESKNVTD